MFCCRKLYCKNILRNVYAAADFAAAFFDETHFFHRKNNF